MRPFNRPWWYLAWYRARGRYQWYVTDRRALRRMGWRPGPDGWWVPPPLPRRKERQ